MPNTCLPSFSIGICDDCQEDIDHLASLCKSFFESHGMAYSISTYTDASAILSDDRYYDLLFMDIELGADNGIDTVKQLLHARRVFMCIYVTSHPDYMGDAFGLRVLGFLSKPADRLSLNRYLSQAVHEHSETQTVRFPALGDRQSFRICDIMYIESFGPSYRLHTGDGIFLVSEPVSRMFSRISTTMFAQIAKGIYVNLSQVKCFGDQTVTLSDGSVIRSSKRYLAGFQSLMIDYLRDSMR